MQSNKKDSINQFGQQEGPKKMFCRTAPSLGEGFAGTPDKVWGTAKYDSEKHLNEPVCFFGMYGLPDFYALWRHKGTRYILWAGSDITHFKHGYWLDDTGRIRVDNKGMAQWINENCYSYVENDVEKIELLHLGIESIVVPSFLGDVKDYEIEYEPGRPKFYTSVSGNDFELYGWDHIEDMADEYEDVEFHLYGNTEPWYTDRQNIHVHGRVPQEQMDKEIKKMTGALRLTEHDGFSEILAKSVLWGQWPVSPFIEYPYIASSIKKVLNRDTPNTEGRNYYLKHLNKYPFNVSKHKSSNKILEK